MGNAIAGIDHVIIGVPDLERARAGRSRLDFTLSPRGRHIGQGTGNCCIMFASDYIELLGIVGSSDFIHSLDAFLARREGLMATALAPAACGIAAAASPPLRAQVPGGRSSCPRAL